jgi:hypothetical protein
MNRTVIAVGKFGPAFASSETFRSSMGLTSLTVDHMGDVALLAPENGKREDYWLNSRRAIPAEVVIAEQDVRAGM